MSKSNYNGNNDGNAGKFEDKLPWHKFIPLRIRDSDSVIGYFDFHGTACSAIAGELKFSKKQVTLFLIPNDEGIPISEISADKILWGDSIFYLKYNDAAWAKLVECIGTIEDFQSRIDSGTVKNSRCEINDIAGTFNEDLFQLFSEYTYPRGNEGKDIFIGYLNCSNIYDKSCANFGFRMTFSSKKIELFLIPTIAGKSVQEMTKDELIVPSNCILVLHYNRSAWDSYSYTLREPSLRARFNAVSGSAGATGGGSAAASIIRRRKSTRRGHKKQRKTRRHMRK